MADALEYSFLHKFWIDYDLPLVLGPRVLVPEWWAFFLISAFAVWITIWTPNFWKIVKRAFLWILGEEQNAVDPRLEDEVVRIVAKSRAAEEGFLELLKLALQLLIGQPIALSSDDETDISRLGRVKIRFLAFCQNLRTVRKDIIQTAIALVFSATFFIGLAAAATAVAYLELDNLALVSSPNCGVWMHPKNQTITAAAQGTTEEMIWIYYRTCYENHPSLQECNLFSYTPLLTTMTDNDECPFHGDVCLLGNNSAVTLDTGFLDSKFLGINSPQRPLFRRRSICAPIVVDGYSAVDNWHNLSSLTTFYYGPQNKSTLVQARSLLAFPLGSPGYSVVTISNQGESDFQPLYEFSSDKGYTTLIFINDQYMQYFAPSSDPIFPAKMRQDAYCLVADPPCWINMAPSPTVLGCVESAQVCTPSLEECYDPWSVENSNRTSWTGWSTAEEGFLIWSGILHSGMGTTLSTRGGYLLDATRRIVANHISLPLEEEQWKLEVRRVFDMAILRIKFEMMFVVRGTRSSEQDFVKFLPDNLRGACTKYKFQANGYKNLSFLGMLTAALMPPLLGLEFAGSSRKMPLIAWIVVGMWELVKAIYRVLRQTPRETVRLIHKVKATVAGLLQYLRNFDLKVFGGVQPTIQPVIDGLFGMLGALRSCVGAASEPIALQTVAHDLGLGQGQQTA